MQRPRTWRACLLWAALVLPALTADRLGMNEPRAVWQQLAGVAVLAAAVAVARWRPLVAFALTAVLSLVAAPALFTVSYGPALGVFALLLGLRAERVRPALVAFGGVCCLGTARIALFGVDPAPEWVVLTGTLLFGCVFPWLGGRYWRQSRQLTAAGWNRAARLEGEQRIAEERARLRERARIAQDMHDSLGHELSLIALRAGALQVAPDLPDHHRTAAADLRVAAADATDRLHRIIGVLREENEPVSLSPPGETVEQLVTRAAESGLPVRWGKPEGGTAVALEPGGVAERVLYRVVREALTNTARHAPGAEVTVVAAREGGGTTVTVTSGRASATQPASSAPPPPPAEPACKPCAPPSPRSAVTSRRVPVATASACGRTSPSRASPLPYGRRRPRTPPTPTPAAESSSPSWPPSLPVSSSSAGGSPGTRTRRPTRCCRPRPTPSCGSGPRATTSRRSCRTAACGTRRWTVRPCRPRRAATAATTARAANCSSPSTTSGSASTTRGGSSPRT
ncbi:histidine kinase [Streptomyces sp. NBC_01017]|uniref:sensor histidine kinase n=1 Tax=Streptomyces sp. NBC_01017 TaxID=2903721 RepID=UPI00386811ED|nr:histidine kinase [Streptomyces sp. NBC_01017]